MFDVVTGAARIRARCRMPYLILSFGAHILVLGSLLGASLWSLGESPDPPVPVVFFSGPSAPPLPRGNPDGGDKPDRRWQHESRKIPLREPVQAPASIPVSDLHPPAEIPGAGNSAPGGDRGESIGPLGESNGADGGPGGQFGPGTGGGLATLATPGVVAPVLLRQLQPEYPEAARRLRLQGLVVVSAVIETDGSVDETVIVHSSSPLLEESALRAIRQWRYRPGTLSGKSVRVLLTVQIDFSLH